MPGKSKVWFRALGSRIETLLQRKQSAFIFGPRQVGKTTLVASCLEGRTGTLTYPLQDPLVRLELERDPGALVRQLAAGRRRRVFLDEAQKVPEVFDAVQHLIDRRAAHFLITGSSARKLRRRGTNLLPGRVKTFRLDPLQWSELGWIEEPSIKHLAVSNLPNRIAYSFERSLVFGSLPGIVAQPSDGERRDFLKAYSQIYLEEEIRAEALARKIGAFSRFLELAAAESGTAPNLNKLSMESGISAPAVKEYYRVLEDTMIVERIDPFLRGARKRILSTPRYYFFDLGVRNALARAPLDLDLANAQKGLLFEHAVVLEVIRRLRALGKDHRVGFWRTAGGAEVDCVIDAGRWVIPIEIKATARVGLGDVRGLTSFLETYGRRLAPQGYVITLGRVPERLSSRILALPWAYL